MSLRKSSAKTLQGASVDEPDAKKLKKEDESDHNKMYFDSYTHLGIHEEMLRDEQRTNAYEKAIMGATSAIAGRVVADVGCGTGILSLFCARAGARKVYAIDASGIAEHARAVAAANGFAGVVEVVHGKVEDIDLPEKVDVIVSEWMGYFLLFESMLPSVIHARDKWLKPGGLLLPNRATLHLAPFCDYDFYQYKVDFWDNVYGFDMSALKPVAIKNAFEEPVVEIMPPQCLVTAPTLVTTINIATAVAEDVQKADHSFRLQSMISGDVTGFAGWFDVYFEVPDVPVVRLSTGPLAPPTHWRQILFFLDKPMPVVQDDMVKGTVKVNPSSAGFRYLDVEVTCLIEGASQAAEVEQTKKFSLKA